MSRFGDDEDEAAAVADVDEDGEEDEGPGLSDAVTSCVSINDGFGSVTSPPLLLFNEKLSESSASSAAIFC